MNQRMGLDKIQKFLLVAFGFFLCFVLAVSIPIYQKVKHPLGAITNQDYSLIQIQEYGGQQFELRKGESKLLPYGNYQVTIPETKATFNVFKNNRGNCFIRSINGVLVVQVDENAGINGSFP
jgi:hypothetical protein